MPRRLLGEAWREPEGGARLEVCASEEDWIMFRKSKRLSEAVRPVIEQLQPRMLLSGEDVLQPVPPLPRSGTGLSTLIRIAGSPCQKA